VRYVRIERRGESVSHDRNGTVTRASLRGGQMHVEKRNARMLEESLNPNPDPVPYARLLALAAQKLDKRSTYEWAHAWHDREGYWTQLRTLGHWLQRLQSTSDR
jgi:hypothetical protein